MVMKYKVASTPTLGGNHSAHLFGCETQNKARSPYAVSARPALVRSKTSVEIWVLVSFVGPNEGFGAMTRNIIYKGRGS